MLKSTFVRGRADGSMVGLFLCAFLVSLGVIAGLAQYQYLSRADAIEAAQYGMDSARARGSTARWDMSTYYRGQVVHIVVLARSDSGASAVPPGVPRNAAAKSSYVSPALNSLLRDPQGESLLVPRLRYPIAGVITSDGLTSGTELRAYVFESRKDVELKQLPPAYAPDRDAARTISRFQGPDSDPQIRWLLLGFAILSCAIPGVAIVASIARMGSLQRDARLSTLWMIGVPVRKLRFLEAIRVGAWALSGGAAAMCLLIALRTFSSPLSESKLVSSLHAVPVGIVLLSTVVLAAVAASVARQAISWTPEVAFGAGRMSADPIKTPRSRRLLLAFGAGLVGCGVIGLLNQSMSRLLVLVEYGCLAGLVVVAARWMPGGAAIGAGVITSRMGASGLLAGARLRHMRPSTHYGLVALCCLVAVLPAVQGMLKLTGEGREETLPALSSTIVEVVAPPRMTGQIAALDGVVAVDEPRGVSTSSECSRRYNCMYQVRTNGSPETVERLRVLVGWTGFVYSVGDPPGNELYGSTLPRTLSILRGLALVAMLGAVLAVGLGYLEAFYARRREDGAAKAMGAPPALFTRARTLELLIPVSVLVIGSAILGLAILLQLAAYYARSIDPDWWGLTWFGAGLGLSCLTLLGLASRVFLRYEEQRVRR